MIDLISEHEALLEFVYLCPLGIAQLDALGNIEMMNPVATQILVQLAGGLEVTNLFEILEPFAPALRGLVDGLTADRGSICEAYPLEIPDTLGRRTFPLVVTVTLLKLGPNRIMAVAADVSVSTAQERAARAAESRFRAILDGVRDYAIFGVDLNGRVENWNKSAERAAS